MGTQIRKSGRKNRKHGRNKVKCNRYAQEGRREKNKKRRAAKIARRRNKKEGEHEHEATRAW